MTKAREGDFIELYEGTIFECKGIHHPPHGVVAYPRYIQDSRGDRTRYNLRYRRVYSPKEREELLREKFKDYYKYNHLYDRMLPIIPWSAVKTHFKPQETIEKLSHSAAVVGIRLRALEFVEAILKKADIPTDSLGISGSVMLGLETFSSDIDLIVYGLKAGHKVRAAVLEAMTESDAIRRLSESELKELYRFRSKDTVMGYEDFERVESRKSNQGVFKDSLFFIRYIKDWGEHEEQCGDYLCRRIAYARIRGVVADSNEAHLTPSIYKLKDAHVLSGPEWLTVDRLVSWRGRFAEQALEGEYVEAQGYVEEVYSHIGVFRQMVVGEYPSDTILPITAYSTCTL